MRVEAGALQLAATDLSSFLGCRHRTALEIEVALGMRRRPYRNDPLLEVLFARGLEHEKAFVETLRTGDAIVVDLSGVKDAADACARTEAAMRAGADAIVQAALRFERWHGLPDVLRRVPVASALGAWSYEVVDTKLAAETRAGTILQLALYTELLARVLERTPECFEVVTPGSRHRYRVDDYAAYFRLVRDRLAALGPDDGPQLAAANYPEPVDHCDVCPWYAGCDERRHADDHLSLVAGISRLQSRELESRGFTTLAALAEMPVPLGFTPRRGAPETYERVRDQARLQHASRGAAVPLHELRALAEGEGLARLPEPSPGDVFLDLEGDSFARAGGREYLFGVVTLDASGAPVYEGRWAITDGEERAGFEAVMDLIAARAAAHPGLHVYHYAPYEPAAFKRLMGRYATRGNELDALLRRGGFIDLYGIVRQALLAGIERYSIKNLEVFYAFRRAVELKEASRNLRRMEQALELGCAGEVAPEIRAAVEGYNRDDCVSTLHLRDWLERLRAEVERGGTMVPRPPLQPDEPSARVDERAQRVAALRARLLAGIPENREARDPDQQARWLVAYLLDWHRREDRAEAWDYFRLRELPEADLFDEPRAVAGLAFLERVEEVLHKTTGRPTGSVVDRYAYPAQEMEIRRKDELVVPDGKFGDVVAVDRKARTLDVKKGRDRVDQHPAAAFAHTYISSAVLEDALFRLGEQVADGRAGNPLADQLLRAAPPRLKRGSLAAGRGESAVEAAVRIVGALDRTVLAIQGPPGAGKTTSGAEMICALVKSGRRVGVTATGHKVIQNLLLAVAKAAGEKGMPVRLAHKPERDAESVPAPIVAVPKNEDALAALQQGTFDVVGGTAWMWAREDFADAVDVLFVDEAGQMSLANALACSAAAESMVLLGDPQQLEQPVKGTHPDGVAASALEHVIGDHPTIPADRGLFLPVTWRLAPAICAFTSELFYDGKLASKPGLERQTLLGARGLEGSGLRYLPVLHDANRNASDEEVEAVRGLVERLLAAGSRWVDEDGAEAALRAEDVLVVAPYNAHVNRLAEALGPLGVAVGTVDKFQGREAPVVIYSMATSRPEDAPRGLEFLYSRNRINVATSRARCAAFLVASPRLFEPDCRTPRQMRLANAMCRYRELAVEIS